MKYEKVHATRSIDQFEFRVGRKCTSNLRIRGLAADMLSAIDDRENQRFQKGYPLYTIGPHVDVTAYGQAHLIRRRKTDILS